MSFSQTFSRIAALAAALWAAQSNLVLLTAGLYGFSYLVGGQAAEVVVLLASMMQMALLVRWLKAGARGGFSAETLAAAEECSWAACLGVAFGQGLPYAIGFILSLVVLVLGPIGWALLGFVWFALLVAMELYSPLVSVRARGFGEAFGLASRLLLRLENRVAFTTSAFWYPALLGMAASFLQLLLGTGGGFVAAVLGFLLAAFQIVWYAAAQLVVYENVWRPLEANNPEAA